VDPGVRVVYNLDNDVDSLTLEFLDGAGTVIQRFTGSKADTTRPRAPSEEEFFFGGGPPRRPAVKAGSQSFLWNLRYAGYTDFQGRIFWAAGNAGPVAVPGRYQVRLTAGGTTQTQDFDVKLDPRLDGKVTVAQLKEQFDLTLKVRDRVSDANEAVIRVRNIKSQVDDRLKKTGDAAITSLGGTVKTRLSAPEEEIYQVKNRSSQDPLNFPIMLNNKLAALIGTVQSADAAPTAQSYQVYQYLDSLVRAQLDLVDGVISSDVTQLNNLLKNANLPAIDTAKPKREGTVAAPGIP
jgi:hypothetical protein